MLRKILLVTVAVASLSAASLAPTPASAYWHGGWGWGGGWGPGWRGGVLVGALPGVPDGALAGDGVAVSFAVSSRARGVRAGSWSTDAGD